MQQFFYSGQIRRFITQFVRMMSNFQVEFGRDRDGETSLLRVPVVYGDMNRQVAQILRGNTENALNHVPSMAVYISGLSYDRERVQEPYHVDKIHLRERTYNPVTGNYMTNQQDSITVERLMPVPYKLELKLDIWTSNVTQKLQLIEQIACLFNPSLEIQSTDNYLDWTSLSMILLTNVNWSSQTIPAGTDDSIDIMSLTFEMPIWLTTPAKVMKLGVIQKIIASIYDSDGELNEDSIIDSNLLSRQYITPLQYGVLLIDNTLLLVKQSEIVTDDGKIGTRDSWPALIDVYGVIKDGTSQIRLQIDDDGNEIIGTIAEHPMDSSLLLFNIFEDTLPANTEAPISAIIDPFAVDADDTDTLRPPAGTRYLILEDIGSDKDNVAAESWKGLNNLELIAKKNDIIEYNGVNWWVSFVSEERSDVSYVTNLNTAIQYKWDGIQWTKSYHRHYPAGQWSLLL
jgi:hypothetical protein